MANRLISLGNGVRAAPHPLGGYGVALLLVASATLLGLPIGSHWGTAPIVLLYIPAVLAAATYGGLWPALVSAFAATLAYNYFFTAPYRTFLIHNAGDIVTVIGLFVVGLVTSHLAGSLRDQSRLAVAHAARNATIAGVARKLLSCRDEAQITTLAVNELSGLFGCHAALVTDRDSLVVVASVPQVVVLAPSDIAAAAHTLSTGEPSGRGMRRIDLADWQFRPVSSNSAILACVGLARDDGISPVTDAQSVLLDNLLDQVALAIGRAQLEEEARDFATLRERDGLRSALLASIGEEVKPRLNAIAAHARTLKRGGSGASDKTLLNAIATEAGKLDRYVDNLLDLRPGEIQEPILVRGLAIDLSCRSVSRGGERVHLTPKEYAVLAELARNAGRVMTHVQLLRSVWGPAHQSHIEYLRVAVRSLRQKIELDPAQPDLIVNEPAVGYRLATS